MVSCWLLGDVQYTGIQSFNGKSKLEKGRTELSKKILKTGLDQEYNTGKQLTSKGDLYTVNSIAVLLPKGTVEITDIPSIEFIIVHFVSSLCFCQFFIYNLSK